MSEYLARLFLPSLVLLLPIFGIDNIHNSSREIEYVPVIPKVIEITERKLVNGIFWTEEEINCLATNIYFESRGEPVVGQLAVANVTINRVKSDRFPDSICEVVYQAKLSERGTPLRNQCQFSWYCDGKLEIIESPFTYERNYRLAEFISEREIIDVTGGALYYHNMTVDPIWAQEFIRTITIEGHIFYKRG